ncbi:hypothetical protein I551_5830 [Mycobacterium ulcerans str. Harvey]|uniref:Amidase family protein n=1 Tax=Mycobacterium ulcerans str. Harvey TaxID=1299332 RepID=A0ABP3A8H7_MYCUL|nr:hypothetical protein I551_5830 [Mycobacterium ulcerans str. Harvey]
MVGASGFASGAVSGSGGPRLPTLTDLLYQLASGSVTSVELTRRSLREIEVSQSTLNAFRVVLTESALADAAAADRRRPPGMPRRCWASRSRSRTTSTLPVCRPRSAPRDTSGQPPTTVRLFAV